MKYVLTNEQMRSADEYTIQSLGVPSRTLMERAGKALADRVELWADGEILCVCGGGNNGGDGFVCARIVKNKGYFVDVVCVAEKRSADCASKEKEWKDCGGEVLVGIPDKKYSVIVDCLYGTGFHGKLQGKDEEMVLQINALRERGAKVLAADIPSGVNGKNGKVDGVAVFADETLCVGEIKTGILCNDGIDYAGKVTRADIGIALPNADYAVWTDRERAKELLPKRKRNSHKGSYGKTAIVAGSAQYTGAAYLSAAACLRSGVGYTTLFLPKEILPYYMLKAPEALLCNTNEGGMYAFNEEKMRKLLAFDCVAYGMGMGASEEAYRGAKWLIENYEGKLLLDADGLNSIAKYGDLSVFKKKKGVILLTPHVKEFSRLSGLSVQEIVEDSISAAKEFAKKHGVCLLLKSATSVITDGKEVALNSAGTSGQAKGGSGDVLAGMIAGLCGSGLSVLDGGVLGAYLVGKSAELAEEEVGNYAMTASDLIENVGKAFLSITKNTDKDRSE